MFPEPLPKHVLLLQGPNGPFFRRYARDLVSRGAKVTKINFNPAESFFFLKNEASDGNSPNVVSYRGTLTDWPEYFREYVIREEVDAVMLFGDCRPIHVAIREAADELGVGLWVFEEGYLRPDYVTLERGGVNGNSPLSSDPDFYREAAKSIARLRRPPQPIGATFTYAALWACVNGWANTLFGWRYPNYTHHRDIRAIPQGLLWIRGGIRKVYYKRKESSLTTQFTGSWSGDYFLVPLQVHNDSQVSHSDFPSVPAFIRHVAAEFAAHAPANTRLVFKHHPRDRPYRDYTDRIANLAEAHNLGDRLLYIHDLHLPTMLQNARGTVVMNSTVGLSSLLHGTPVKALGKAVYNIPELTHQGTLASFFIDPGEVDVELFEAFTSYVRETTQINGSFDRRLEGSDLSCGMKLPPSQKNDIANAREKAKRRA